MSQFPAALITYTTFTNADTLSTMGHGARHLQHQDDIQAVSAKVGITGSADNTSHEYKLSLLSGGTKAQIQSAMLDSLAANTYTGSGVIVLSTSPALSGGSWAGSPTLTTPTITDFTNMAHTHANAAGGGQIGTAGIASNAVTASKIETQQGWQALPYNNSWVDYDTTLWGGGQYYKDSLGIVHMRGLIKGGTAGSGITVGTLPVGYRPQTFNQLFLVATNDVYGRLEVHPDGTVVTGAGISVIWVSLANIHFYTG